MFFQIDGFAMERKNWVHVCNSVVHGLLFLGLIGLQKYVVRRMDLTRGSVMIIKGMHEAVFYMVNTLLTVLMFHGDWQTI